jgi:WD40 repeat protein
MQTTQSYENWNIDHTEIDASEDIILMLVPDISSTIHFYERETGQFIYSMDEEPNWTVLESYFFGDLLAVLSVYKKSLVRHLRRKGNYIHRIRIWRVNSSNATCLKEFTFNDKPLYLSSPSYQCISGDKFFITVSFSYDKSTVSKPMYLCQFISCKTLEIERSLSCKTWRTMYHGGLFFIGRDDDGLVRILDVASGTYLHDIRVIYNPKDWPLKVSTSSKYLVAMDGMKREERTLSVYDLQAMRNPKAKPATILLNTFVTTLADELLMDETRIVFYSLFSGNEIIVIDFGDHDRFKCLVGTLCRPFYRPSEPSHEEEKCILPVTTG